MTTPNIDADIAAWYKLVEISGQDWRPPLNVYIHELAKEHGMEFHGEPWSTWKGSGWRRGRERECFQNATHFMLRHGLTYCEGIAFAGMLAVHHAWCVTDDGRVVDPTWRMFENRPPEHEWEYLGIPFRDKYVRRAIHRSGHYGIFHYYDFRKPLPKSAVARLTNRPKADIVS